MMTKKIIWYIVFVTILTTYFGMIIFLIKKAIVENVHDKVNRIVNINRLNIRVRFDVKYLHLNNLANIEVKLNTSIISNLYVSAKRDVKNYTSTIIVSKDDVKNNKSFACQCFNEKWKDFTKHTSILNDDSDELRAFITNICEYNGSKSRCNSSSFTGSLDIPTYISSFNDTLNSRYINLDFVHKGGWWVPLKCRSKQNVAIIIPFRNREQHLKLLLHHLHPILMRQNLHYRIFVIEQSDNHPFNKGRLLNAGVLELRKYFPYECLVFQDVDLLPEDDRVDYGCSQSPMHLAVYIDKFNYTILYPTIFGGVVSFRICDYKRVNGFSNLFWVWGGEDDDLYQRVKLKNMKITRGNENITRYTMLRHANRELIRTEKQKRESLKAMEVAIDQFESDGLNSVKYRVIERRNENYHTLIKIDLMKYTYDLEEEYLKLKREHRKREKQKGIDSAEVESLL